MEEEACDLMSILGDKSKEIAADLKKQDESIYSDEKIKALISEYYDMTAMGLNSFREHSPKDLLEISLEQAIDGFLNEVWNNSPLKYLYDTSLEICDYFSLTPNVYAVTCFSFVWFVATGKREIAEGFLKPLFQPAFTVLRIEDLPKENGRKGGRPKNRHKTEALNLAREKWNTLSTAGLGAVITAVKHQLERKYKDAPSVSTLKVWLKDADFRPKESKR